MNQAKNVLLASHGTEGALAAEEAAMELCSAGAILRHFIVVPDLWKGMTGDDWLNNGSTRDRFTSYLEAELGREIDEHLTRVRCKAEARNIHYSSEVVLGEPDKCLVEACSKTAYDVVIMGSPRPKGKSGLRSRMTTKLLAKELTTPLMVIPYPDE